MYYVVLHIYYRLYYVYKWKLGLTELKERRKTILCSEMDALWGAGTKKDIEIPFYKPLLFQDPKRRWPLQSQGRWPG